MYMNVHAVACSVEACHTPATTLSPFHVRYEPVPLATPTFNPTDGPDSRVVPANEGACKLQQFGPPRVVLTGKSRLKIWNEDKLIH